LEAFGRSIEEVREIIGCDALIYQDVDAMKRAILAAQQAGSSVIDGFDASCFDGVYVTGDLAAADIARMGQSRVNGDENASDNSRLSLPNFNDE
jgi:amidophosphoribosyltransferase